MMGSYKDYPAKGIDVSQWNDIIETTFKPDYTRVKAAGMLFAIARVGYGIVEDRLFDYSWKKIREAGLDRMGYWYLDYYSHKNTGMTGAEWGIEQAQQCWDIMKADPGPVYLDLEASSFGGVINFVTAPAVLTIARAWLTEWMRLSGDKKRIYCSPGFMPYFGSWFKDAELWLAWYNKAKTTDDIAAVLRNNNWIGKCVMWQYASDGDINDDGIGDGWKLGMEAATLDLNVFLGSMAEYSAWVGNTTPPVIPPVEDEIIVPPVEPSKFKQVGVMKVNATSGLNIRNKAAIPSSVIGWLPNGKEVEILETVISGSNIWARVGQGQWCAVKYQGVTYIV